ncbi:MAG TPA: metallophosphoesterase [Pirellulales bacterium]|nr:metallophosphoesterase [Pirellulales bacterium]
MHVLDWLCYAAALVGHLALCAAFNNRVHAMHFPRAVIETSNWIVRLWAVGLPASIAAIGLYAGPQTISLFTPSGVPLPVLFYVAVCAFVGAVLVPWEWLRRKLTVRPLALGRQLSTRHDFWPQFKYCSDQSLTGRLLCALPLNESLQIECTEKHLVLPNLPSELEGLSIAHISDLHFTGRVPREFFERAVEMVNELEPDLVAVTGDICEHAHTVSWVAPLLGALRSRLGVYYVVGNHDVRKNLRALRRELRSTDLIDLGGRWRQLDISGTSIILAGNELPWSAPAADMKTCAPIEEARRHGDPEPFKLLLSHSPDQFPWARRHGFDLMLAGHTHGGQIVFPGIGSILCPSRFGSRYASGAFYEPPTVLHVSRGLSGDTPLRWNCRPEITRLVLVRGDAPARLAVSQAASAAAFATR